MFNDIITIGGNELTKNYVESLNKEERIALIDPIFHYFRNVGFTYPDDVEKVKKEYVRLCKLNIDTSKTELFNNSSVGTYICRYFCKSFFSGTEMKGGKKAPDMITLFNDDVVLKKIIQNRLGIEWYKKNGELDVEAFPISFRQIVQGMRSTRTVNALSLFKPDIAMYIYKKYSNEGDVVFDFSAGFGGRILGAAACNRKYIGVDPLTADEINNMKEFFNWNNCLIIKGCSEDVVLEKNSVDLSFSSPPYFNQEVFSDDKSQAYNKGEDYFYNIYWEKTLENIKAALKPNGIFALNVKNYPKMLEMAEDKFQKTDQIGMRTVRSHLNKTAGVEKMEYIYIFKK